MSQVGVQVVVVGGVRCRVRACGMGSEEHVMINQTGSRGLKGKEREDLARFGDGDCVFQLTRQRPLRAGSISGYSFPRLWEPW